MTDPVKHCDLYKDEGCAHVDGFLCDFETCTMRFEYWMKKNVKWEPKAFQVHEKFLEEKNLKSLNPAPENKKCEKRV